jgi:SAM-dependent methyltransferase
LRSRLTLATHQEIGGITDQQLLERMVERYANRFDAAYWEFFEVSVGRYLPPRPTIADLGCGPGLYLRDLAERRREAALHGFDITPAMIAYASGLRYPGARPTLVLHDITRDPLPLATGTVDLVCMTALLHLFDDPYPVLAETRRVLRPGGLFLLDDWIRTSLPQYLGARSRGNETRGLKLFAVHNRYTVDDWKWLLSDAGFSLVTTVQFRTNSQIFLSSPRREA